METYPDAQLLLIRDSTANNYGKSNPLNKDFLPMLNESYAARTALNLGFNGDL